MWRRNEKPPYQLLAERRRLLNGAEESLANVHGLSLLGQFDEISRMLAGLMLEPAAEAQAQKSLCGWRDKYHEFKERMNDLGYAAVIGYAVSAPDEPDGVAKDSEGWPVLTGLAYLQVRAFKYAIEHGMNPALVAPPEYFSLGASRQRIWAAAAAIATDTGRRAHDVSGSFGLVARPEIGSPTRLLEYGERAAKIRDQVLRQAALAEQPDNTAEREAARAWLGPESIQRRLLRLARSARSDPDSLQAAGFPPATGVVGSELALLAHQSGSRLIAPVYTQALALNRTPKGPAGP